HKPRRKLGLRRTVPFGSGVNGTSDQPPVYVRTTNRLASLFMVIQLAHRVSTPRPVVPAPAAPAARALGPPRAPLPGDVTDHPRPPPARRRPALPLPTRPLPLSPGYSPAHAAAPPYFSRAARSSARGLFSNP